MKRRVVLCTGVAQYFREEFEVKHSITIVKGQRSTTEYVWKARCSCGWSCAWRLEEAQAQDAGDDHQLRMLPTQSGRSAE